MFKVVSFNANGIRAAARKGFFDWFAKQDIDVLCVQELKAQEDQLDDATFNPEGYYRYCQCAVKKGYSGVAIYSKQKPDKVIDNFDYDLGHHEGRYIQADFGNLSVVSLYLPSGSSGDERQAIKYECMAAFEKHLTKIKASKREFIICGDWNIVHKEIDIKNWKGNQKNSGCLPVEREWLDKLFGPMEFVDAFREVNQEPHQYTWWSQRGQARANNVGWRLDYQVTTAGLKDKIDSTSIYTAENFSDHAPLVIDYKF
tara:strand:+ start:88225 stop:88995 length:771 start_codon:yes stop_codon:yes gene_type:complete